MFNINKIKEFDSIYKNAVKSLPEVDKVFDSDMAKTQFMWSAYEEYIKLEIKSNENVSQLTKEVFDKIQFSKFLQEQGLLDNYSDDKKNRELVKDALKTLNDVDVKNIAEEADVVDVLKRFVTSELEPDLQKRAIKIILVQKQMLNTAYAHFPEMLE